MYVRVYGNHSPGIASFGFCIITSSTAPSITSSCARSSSSSTSKTNVLIVLLEYIDLFTESEWQHETNIWEELFELPCPLPFYIFIATVTN